MFLKISRGFRASFEESNEGSLEELRHSDRHKRNISLMHSLWNGTCIVCTRTPVHGEEAAAAYNAKAEELAFRDFCHLVLCMNEFVYVD